MRRRRSAQAWRAPRSTRRSRTKKNTLNRAERSKRHPAWPARTSGGSRSGRTAVRPAAVARNLMYSSAISRSGTRGRSVAPADATGKGCSVTPGQRPLPARSAHAACDTAAVTTSSEWMSLAACPGGGLQRIALGRGGNAIRCVTRAASGSGSTPARCASSVNSAPPPIPESSSRSARPSASRRSAVSTRSGPPVKATIPSACAGRLSRDCPPDVRTRRSRPRMSVCPAAMQAPRPTRT